MGYLLIDRANETTTIRDMAGENSRYGNNCRSLASKAPSAAKADLFT